MVSPSVTLPAPSWGGSLKARQVWARLAHGRTAPRRELCQIGPLSRARALQYRRRTWLRASRAFSLTGLGCLLFPEEARFAAVSAFAYQAGAQGSSSRSFLRGCFS